MLTSVRRSRLTARELGNVPQRYAPCGATATEWGHPMSETQPLQSRPSDAPGPYAAHEPQSRDEFNIRIPKPGSGGPARAALKTTEFWMTLGLVFAVLLSTYLDEDTLNRVDGWRFATFAVMAYVISRGLAKLGNRSDATHERNIDVR